MRRGMGLLLSAVVFVGALTAMFVAAGTGSAHLLTMMSGLVAGAMHATRQPNYSLGAAALALVAAGAVVVTGWLALDAGYPLWAWALALVVGMLAPLLPEVATAQEDDAHGLTAVSLPADRVMADYTRAARF